MNDAETFAAILKYGLSIRQVPLEVVHLMEPRHFKEGMTRVKREIKLGMVLGPGGTYELTYNGFKKSVKGKRENYCFSEKHKRIWQKFVRMVTIPEHAGYWMCQQVRNTSSNVRWMSKEHNLAPTLQESVALFMNTLMGDQHEQK